MTKLHPVTVTPGATPLPADQPQDEAPAVKERSAPQRLHQSGRLGALMGRIGDFVRSKIAPGTFSTEHRSAPEQTQAPATLSKPRKRQTTGHVVREPAKWTFVTVPHVKLDHKHFGVPQSLTKALKKILHVATSPVSHPRPELLKQAAGMLHELAKKTALRCEDLLTLLDAKKLLEIPAQGLKPGRAKEAIDHLLQEIDRFIGSASDLKKGLLRLARGLEKKTSAAPLAGPGQKRHGKPVDDLVRALVLETNNRHQQALRTRSESADHRTLIECAAIIQAITRVPPRKAGSHTHYAPFFPGGITNPGMLKQGQIYTEPGFLSVGGKPAGNKPFRMEIALDRVYGIDTGSAAGPNAGNDSGMPLLALPGTRLRFDGTRREGTETVYVFTQVHGQKSAAATTPAKQGS